MEQTWIGMQASDIRNWVLGSALFLVTACIFYILTGETDRLIKLLKSLWAALFFAMLACALLVNKVWIGIALLAIAFVTFGLLPVIFRKKPEVIGLNNAVPASIVSTLLSKLKSAKQERCIDDLEFVASTLSSEHQFVRRSLTHIARNTVAHLLSSDHQVFLGINQYIDLLKIGTLDPTIEDITVVNVVPPDEWGDRTAQLNEVQQEAWEYLDLQISVKNDASDAKPLRIRRYLAMTRAEKELMETKLPSVWNAFIKAHEDGHLDLYWLPTDKLRRSDKRYLEDATIFYSSNWTGWKLASTVLRTVVSKNDSSLSPQDEYIFRTHIRADDKYLKNEYSHYLRRIVNLSENLWTNDRSNAMPDEFMRKIGLKLQ